MIKKNVRILEVLDNSVIYEVTITTEQVVTFTYFSLILPIDSVNVIRIQRGSLVAVEKEKIAIDSDNVVGPDAKYGAKLKLDGMKQSFEASLENLAEDVKVYEAVIEAYNKKHPQ